MLERDIAQTWILDFRIECADVHSPGVLFVIGDVVPSTNKSGTIRDRQQFVSTKSPIFSCATTQDSKQVSRLQIGDVIEVDQRATAHQHGGKEFALLFETARPGRFWQAFAQ